jgi:predicted dinucleotide-binding enzyme
VAKTLAAGFLKHGHEVTVGTRETAKLSAWKAEQRGVAVGSFADAAKFGQMIVLAVKGIASADELRGADTANLSGKTVVDATNPITDDPPVNGVLKFFTNLNESLMERFSASTRLIVRKTSWRSDP